MIAGQMDVYDVLVSMGVPATLPPQPCGIRGPGPEWIHTVCDLPYGHEGPHEGQDARYPADRLAWA